MNYTILIIGTLMLSCLAGFLGFLWAGFTSCKQNILDREVFKSRWVTSTLVFSLILLVLVKIFSTF